MRQWIEAFVAGWIPSPRTVLWLAPLSAVYVVLAAGWVGRLRCGRGIRAPYTRKIFHVLIFTVAGVLHLAAGRTAVVVYGSVVAAAVLVAVWRGDGFPFYEAMARPSDAPRRTLFILVPLLTTAAGGVLANLLFPAHAYVGYLVCGWGDALGEPVGARWGSHPYRVPSLAGVRAQRSLEGSAAVTLGGAVAAAAGLLAVGHGLPPAVTVGLACGAGGAAVEAVSTHGMDNLTVQVAAAGLAAALL
ncbi:MAG: hypothetical protein ACE5HP_05445 [Gemmatimonadota bacterium]